MRADEQDAYTAYVHARMVALRRTAYHLCGDWDTAHDLVQNTFVLLYRHWHRAAAAHSQDAYVRTMLVRVFLGERRTWSARHLRFVAALPETPAETPPDLTEARLDLRAALQRLAPGQRAVLVLRYWEGLDIAETAQVLRCSTGTVKSQTSYAISALRKLMPDYAGDAGEAR